MVESDQAADDRPGVTLNPSGLGQYISYSGCPRFFRLKFFDLEIVNERKWYDPNAGSDLFSELGLAYEEQQLKTLAAQSSRVVGDTESDGELITYDETWETSGLDGTNADIETQWGQGVRTQLVELIEAVAERDPNTMDGPVVLFQIPMYGRIGVWDVAGIADLVMLEPLPDSRGVQSRVLEVKTSWKDKTSHQIQSTIYSILLDTVVSECDVDHNPAATVVNREADLSENPLSELSPIDLPSRRAEVKRLLKRDGELHQLARRSFDDVGYRLERKCDGCPYNGVCFTKAIESRDPALLNLTQGNQERLKAHGVETIAELTELFEREEGTKPYNFDELPVEDEETVRALESEGTLANRLDKIVQRAQVLRGELDPTYESFSNVEYLRGSGNGNLPEDDPPPQLPDGACPRNELIRVYLYVQHDHVRDRLVLLAAKVDSDKTDPRRIVEFSERLPTEREESLDVEGDLLEPFFEQLIEAIQDTKAKIGGGVDEGYVHLYTYSTQERDALMEGVQRQSSVFGSSAVRDLLGLREGLDQPMVSVVHNDITSRLTLRYPGTGLIQTVEQMQAFADDSYPHRWFSNDDWEADIDGKRVDLREVFRTGLFEGKRAFVNDGDSIRLLLGDEDDPDEEPDGFYPLYNRFGNQIPLEYLWAARGELDDVVDGDDGPTFTRYRYYDESASEPIGQAEVEALAQCLTDALEHVERAIQFKNWQIDKQPLDLSRLPTFSLENVELDRACQEYLDLEHTTNYQGCLDHYIKPPRKRIQAGDSTIFRVTNVESAGQWDLRVEGELLYDELFRNPDQVIDSCRISGAGEGGSGSWRVMSKLEREGNEFRHVNATYPRYIANSIKATVEMFDRTERTITVKASTHGGYGRERYIEWHRSATMDSADAEDDDYTTLVCEGDLFILDPYADSYPAVRAYEALERTDSNALYHQLNRAFRDGETEQFERRFCSPSAVEAFIDTFEGATGKRPRGKQAEFVQQVDQSVAVLQGPPGTGKTSFTLAPAVLARMAAAEDEGNRLLTVVTGPSHTSVNEAMEDILTNWAELTDNTATTAATQFVRVRSEGAVDELDRPVHEHVSFIDYYNAEDVVEVTDLLRPHVLSESRATNHLVVFTTPTSLRGVINKCSGELFALDNAEEVMDASISFVDLLAIDEASMLDLPSTLLSSAFLQKDSQTLLIGDHRQMEPVQQHDWQAEDRRTIEENVPFMSVLNFVRFLRGDLEETEFAFANSPEIGDAIPITRLDRTYRLHSRVAELLTDLVYTDDGIKLESNQTETIDRLVPSTNGVETAMKPTAPVSLIIHSEDESQDANRTEVAIIQALLSALEESQPEETGIVTPHNAQKGRLNQRFSRTATIDTVERFQGGERDIMIISATASDPDYVRSEAEFLLNPNRLNVAMSRMKKKLVIVASESVFEVTPADADKFDQTLIWKRLYDALGVTENSPTTAVWDGQLLDFCPEGIEIPRDGETTDMEIFALEAE